MTGNDIFLARYYSPYFGRFLSPDWSAKVTPVPYATFADPQSLNLYAYVRNNPLTRIDADGHDKINLNQDFDKLIKAAQTQLKDKSLSKVVQKELKDQIQGFKDANAAKGAVSGFLDRLDSIGQRNGLGLSDFALTTSPKTDFPKADVSKANVEAGAFVMPRGSGYEGTIYLLPHTNLLGTSRGSDAECFGASAMRHEQVHLNDGGEHDAYKLQLQIFHKFSPQIESREFYNHMEDWIQNGIDSHPDN